MVPFGWGPHYTLGTMVLQRVSPVDTSEMQTHTVLSNRCHWTLAGCSGKTLTLYCAKWVPCQGSQRLKEFLVRRSFYVLFKFSQISMESKSESKLGMPGRQYEWRLRVVITVAPSFESHGTGTASNSFGSDSFFRKFSLQEVSSLFFQMHLYSVPFLHLGGHGKLWIGLEVSQTSYKSTFVFVFLSHLFTNLTQCLLDS